jgi:hypothetical protein
LDARNRRRPAPQVVEVAAVVKKVKKVKKESVDDLLSAGLAKVKVKGKK